VTEVDGVEGQRDVGWGMGDAAIGIVASIVLSQLVAGIAFAAGDYHDADEVPLWLVGLLQIPLWIGLVGAVVLAARKASGVVATEFRLRFQPRDIPIGLLCGAGAQLVATQVTYPVYRLLGIDTDQVGQVAEKLADRAVSGVDVFVLVLLVVLGAPVIEELFYRGLVFGSIERRFGGVAAVLGSSVVFALVHFQLYDLLPLFVAGLVFALLRARYGRLGPGIWAHIGFNLIAVVALLATS
jgi:membrane protease YdiL (CAAX protease family)